MKKKGFGSSIMEVELIGLTGGGANVRRKQKHIRLANSRRM